VNKADPEWKLHIRYDPQRNLKEHFRFRDEVIEKGLNVKFHLVNFNGEVRFKEDLQKFYKNKSVVLSTSEHEAFHYAVAEGALCGLKPVVWDWEWGRAKDLWGRYVKNSIEEMAESVLNYRRSQHYANYVRKNFGSIPLTQKLMQCVYS
jgi:glycosyltransferase involved in cell wall biosynthesis